jgi:hypothetical protein
MNCIRDVVFYVGEARKDFISRDESKISDVSFRLIGKWETQGILARNPITVMIRVAA